MNRRELIKRGSATALVMGISGPAIFMATGCGDTTQLVKWDNILIGALRDVRPIAADLPSGAQIVALIDRTIPVAEALKKAFQDNNHVSALTFLNNLIAPGTGLIVQLADAVGLLADDAKRRIVQGVLAIGMIALRLIAANLQDEVPESGVAEARSKAPEAVANIERAADGQALQRTFAAVKF